MTETQPASIDSLLREMVAEEEAPNAQGEYSYFQECLSDYRGANVVMKLLPKIVRRAHHAMDRCTATLRAMGLKLQAYDWLRIQAMDTLLDCLERYVRKDPWGAPFTWQTIFMLWEASLKTRGHPWPLDLVKPKNSEWALAAARAIIDNVKVQYPLLGTAKQLAQLMVVMWSKAAPSITAKSTKLTAPPPIWTVAGGKRPREPDAEIHRVEPSPSSSVSSTSTVPRVVIASASETPHDAFPPDCFSAGRSASSMSTDDSAEIDTRWAASGCRKATGSSYSEVVEFWSIIQPHCPGARIKDLFATLCLLRNGLTWEALEVFQTAWSQPDHQVDETTLRRNVGRILNPVSIQAVKDAVVEPRIRFLHRDDRFPQCFCTVDCIHVPVFASSSCLNGKSRAKMVEFEV